MHSPPAQSDTRSRILSAAQSLFLEQGYHATAISTILRQAGVNPGSLYHLYPSKEALLIAVLQQYLELLKPVVIAPAEAATPDGLQRPLALLAWYRAGLAMTNCTFGCPIGNLALEIGDSIPEARALIERNFANWSKAVRRWLEAEAHRLPPGTDLARLADMTLIIMEGGIMRARATGSLKPFDDAVDQLRSHINLLLSAAGQPPLESIEFPFREGDLQ